MKLLKKVWLFIFSRGMLMVIFLLSCLDFYLESKGLPKWLVASICTIEGVGGISMEAKHLNLGFVNGIVFRDVTIYADTPAGAMQLTSDQVAFRLKHLNMLLGKLSINRITLIGAKVVLFDDNAEQMYVLSSDLLRYESYFDGNAFLMASFDSNGVSAEISASLLNADILINKLKTDTTKSAKRNEELCRTLEKVRNYLARCEFGDEDTGIKLRLTFDCQNLKLQEAEGTFKISEALIGDTVVSKMRGNIHLDSSNRLTLEKIFWHLNKDEILQADVKYSLHSNIISAELDANISPATISSFLGDGFSQKDAMSHYTKPISISATLPKTELDWKKMSPVSSILIKNLQIGDCSFTEFSAKANMTDGIASLTDIKLLSKDYQHKNMLSGNVRYDIQDKKLGFDLKASTSIKTILDCLYLGSSQDDISKFANGPVSMAISMPMSPLEPEQMNISALLSIQSVGSGKLSFDSADLALSLKNGILTLENADAIMTSHDGRRVSLNGTIDLNPILSHFADSHDDNPMPNIIFKHKCIIMAPRMRQIISALEWDGTVEYSFAQNSVSANAIGSTFLDTFYDNFLAKLNIEDLDYLAPFKCKDTPVAFTAELPWMKIGARDWSFKATANVIDGSFGTFRTKTARASCEVTPERVLINGIEGVTVEGYETSMDMEVQYYPFIYTISNLKLKGDPSIANAFIFSREAVDIYNSIWDNIGWSKEKPANVSMPSLVYKSDDTDATWSIEIEATLNASDVNYSGLMLKNVDCNINLSLPGDLKIDKIEIQTEEGSLWGDCSISFTGTPLCIMQITKTDGKLHLDKIFGAINQEWKDLFSDVKLGDTTCISCTASFYLTGPLNLSVDGSLVTSTFSYNDYNLENFEAKWFLVNDTLFWNVSQSTFLDGDLKITGNYAIKSSKGEMLLICKKLSWDKFTKGIAIFKNGGNATKELISKDPKSTDITPGTFDLTCNVRLMKDWAGRPWHIEGDGHFHLTDADLWQVPLMKSLGALLEFTTFSWLSPGDKPYGTISEVKADMTFNGTKVVVPNLVTDGTLVALTGSGEYSWESHKVFFQVGGEALKKVSIISVLLKPLSWAFQAQLTGTDENSEWTLISGFRKLFQTAE